MENRWRGGGQVKTGADGSIQAVIMETIVKVLAKITRHWGGISWRFMGMYISVVDKSQAKKSYNGDSPY